MRLHGFLQLLNVVSIVLRTLMSAGAGSTAGFEKVARLLGLGPRARSVCSTEALLMPCAFPGCGRTFSSALNLRMHQRMHPGGGGDLSGTFCIIYFVDHSARTAVDVRIVCT